MRLHFNCTSTLKYSELNIRTFGFISHLKKIYLNLNFLINSECPEPIFDCPEVKTIHFSSYIRHSLYNTIYLAVMEVIYYKNNNVTPQDVQTVITNWLRYPKVP